VPKEDKRAEYTAREGKSAEAGKPFNPLTDEPCDEPAGVEDNRSVPIGRPVSPREYDRLKERAGGGAPLSGGSAQEDRPGDDAAGEVE
jgi:hypothetical protein